MRFFERFGSYYNGNLNEARVRWSYRASERLSFDFSQQWNKFQLPVPDGDFSVLFGGFQTNYSFCRFLMLTALVQVNTANNQAFTGGPPALELSPCQRSLRHLHRRTALRQLGN